MLDYNLWREQDWRLIPPKRISLTGELEEPIALQWSGSPRMLEDELLSKGWKRAAKWTVPSATGYLKGETPAGELPPVPHTNLGFLPVLTMVFQNGENHRKVFSLWDTKYILVTDQGAHGDLFVGTVVDQEAIRPLGEFSALKSERKSRSDLSIFSDLENAAVKTHRSGEQVVLAGPKI